MNGQPLLVRHSSGRFSITVPARWSTGEDIEGCDLVALTPPLDNSGFAPNVTLVARRYPRDGVVTPEQELHGVEQALLEARVIERSAVSLGGRTGLRQVLTHRHEQWELTLTQWAVAAEDLVVTMSATCETGAYPRLRDTFDDIAGSLRVTAP